MDSVEPEVIDTTAPSVDESTETNEVDETTAPPEIVDDSEEVDYEGEKFKVPAKLKDALMRQADYTRKTQEVAEARKAIEQHAQEVQQRAQFNQEYVSEVAKVMSIDERLKEYQSLDWNAITDSDPVQAMKLDRQMRELQSEKDRAVQSISEKQQRTALERSQATARQLQEAAAVVAREIKGWSPEVAKKLQETGRSMDYKPEELSQVTDPRFVKLLHKSYLYDQLVKERTAVPPSEPAKPVTRITAVKTTAVTNPDDLTPEQWVSWRNKQIRKNG